MFKNINTVPVYIAGMWPSSEGDPESGTRVALVEKEGGPVVLTGFSSTSGEFRGRLNSSWVGKKLLIIIRESGFKYDYFNPIKVEHWGLFLAIRQEKDLVYSGSKGAKAHDPERWKNWNSTQEHIKASEKISLAVRRAKIAWPLKPLGFAVAVLVGILGFFVHPVIGLVAGVLSFVVMEILAQYLLNRGY